jgi:hypothetical protein
MSELSLLELDAQFSELLPEREALGVMSGMHANYNPCHPHHHHHCEPPKPQHPCDPPKHHHPCDPPKQQHPCDPPKQQHPCDPPKQQHPCDPPRQQYPDRHYPVDKGGKNNWDWADA